MKNNRNNNQEKNKKTYWKDLKEATQSTATGLSMTWEHFQKSIKSLAQSDTKNAVSAKNQSFDAADNSNLGIVTNLFPHETMPIPDNGRYKLHNEIEDCIVCNKCVEVCPVNCIEIDAIRGTEQVGTASDGSPIRFYAAKFDIDMAKCCFCGLCTVVCPTECLTMTKEFDFSQTDVSKMNYEFGNLNEEEVIQKQKEWDDFQAKKANQKTVKTLISKPLPVINKIETPQAGEQETKKPIIKIKLPSPKPKEENQTESKSEIEKIETKKPIIKIKLPSPKPKEENPTESKNEIEKIEIKKPIIKIKLPSPKPKEENQTESKSEIEKIETKKRIIKIKLPSPKPKEENQTESKNEIEKAEIKKPIIKIKLPKPKTENKSEDLEDNSNNEVV